VALASQVKRLAQACKAPNGRDYLSLPFPAAQEFALSVKRTLKDIEVIALENQVIPERYQRNIGTIGIEGQIKLLMSQVAIVGAGGLGGAAMELLARFGIGKMVVIDGDVFVDSNLNRQFLSDTSNLGEPKVDAAKRRIESVNPATELIVHRVFVDENNLPSMVQGSQVILDAVDSIPLRFSLERIARNMGIPLVHGAIAGFLGQVMTIFPGDKGLEAVYGPGLNSKPGIEKELGTPCVTPALVASLQVCEAVKIILGWKTQLRDQMALVNLRESLLEIVELG
jgi:molybdopterin/thiamine biosynthesis adenylyltransferase